MAFRQMTAANTSPNSRPQVPTHKPPAAVTAGGFLFQSGTLGPDCRVGGAGWADEQPAQAEAIEERHGR
jgi:hypothetical protein